MSGGMSARPSNRLVIPIAVVFFTTGFAALLYQVVWQRMLGLFSGSDVRSIMIVTGAYLLGLGVGSFLGSAFADRLKNQQAIRVYALCNLGIAAFAVLSRTLYYDLLFRHLTALAESPITLLIIAFLSLLWPTVLMGLTLPLLARAMVRSISGAVSIISTLYGINTLGAGVGAFVGGWLLIGTLGYVGVLWLGAAISLSAGIVIWAISPAFRMPEDTSTSPIRTESRFDLGLRRVPARVWGWGGLVFVSGFIVIALELIWFRSLDFILKSNAYTYGHLLAFFLIGDALGALYGRRRLSRIRDPRRAFLELQGLIVLYSLVVTWLIAATMGNPESILARYSSAGDGYWILANLQGPNPDPGYLVVLVSIYFIVPAAMLFPPAFLVGMYYPIVQKAVQTDSGVVGQRVGLIEAMNIAGNTMGSIVTGALLLHFVGTADTLRLLGVFGLVFALVLLVESLASLRWPGRLSHLALVGAMLALIVLFPSQARYWAHMHSVRPGRYFDVQEDSTGVAALREEQNGRIEVLANGRGQGSATPFDVFHSLLGVLPAYVHPNPSNSLVIGFGSGSSPFGVGVNPQIQNIICVEIIGSEYDVLRRFSGEQRGIAIRRMFDDPRYELRVGDGRRELVLSRRQYDIIVIDAVLPWTSQAGLLYSQEFYEAVRQRLSEGGVMIQWRPTQRTELTVLHVFPYVLNWGNIALIGSNRPVVFDREAMLRRLNDPAVSSYLAEGRVDTALLREWIASTGTLEWTSGQNRPGGNLNTDLFPRDEYYLNNIIGKIQSITPENVVPAEVIPKSDGASE